MSTQSSLMEAPPAAQPQLSGRVVLVADLDHGWTEIVRALELEGLEFDLLGPRTSSADVVACVAREAGVLVVDLGTEPARGMAMLTRSRQAVPGVPVVVVAENPSIELTRSIRMSGAFYLALHPPAIDEMRGILASAFEALEAQAPSAITCRATRRILVVDDDSDFRASTATLLESFGYDVTTASSGRDGLRALRDTPPDLVILDVMMENDDAGYAVTEAIKFGDGLESVRHVPVLMVSSIDVDPATRFSRAEEIDLITPDVYLTKPLDIPRFLSEVRSLLGQTDTDTARGDR